MPIQLIRKVLQKWGFDPDPLKALVEEWNREKYGEVAVNPPNILAGARADVVVALPAGTAPLGTEGVIVQAPPTLEAGLVAQKAWISAIDTLTITIYNPTAGAIDGAALNWTYYIMAGQLLTAAR
jgi:hypothetical protein